MIYLRDERGQVWEGEMLNGDGQPVAVWLTDNFKVKGKVIRSQSRAEADDLEKPIGPSKPSEGEVYASGCIGCLFFIVAAVMLAGGCGFAIWLFRWLTGF